MSIQPFWKTQDEDKKEEARAQTRRRQTRIRTTETRIRTTEIRIRENITRRKK